MEEALLLCLSFFCGFDYGGVGEPLADVGYPDLRFLTTSSTSDEDDESFDPSYPIAASTGLGYGYIVFFAYFNGFRSGRSVSAKAATSIAASTSVTRAFQLLTHMR